MALAGPHNLGQMAKKTKKRADKKQQGAKALVQKPAGTAGAEELSQQEKDRIAIQQQTEAENEGRRMGLTLGKKRKKGEGRPIPRKQYRWRLWRRTSFQGWLCSLGVGREDDGVQDDQADEIMGVSDGGKVDERGSVAEKQVEKTEEKQEKKKITVLSEEEGDKEERRIFDVEVRQKLGYPSSKSIEEFHADLALVEH